MHPKMKEFREKFTQEFISVLEQKPGTWTEEWINVNQVRNAKTGRKYNGINAAKLTVISVLKGYTDPRFATFNQIKDMGYHLKDAKGTGIRIEYWMPRHYQTKKIISWDAYNQLEAKEKREYSLFPQYSTVFNAKYIDGLEPLKDSDVKVINDFEIKKCFQRLIDNMHIPVIEIGDRSYYSIPNDSIYIPSRTHFTSQYSFYCTLAHELGHATMHPLRLNRETKNYNIEELRAEISSCFFCADAGLKMGKEHIENHKIYIDGYITQLKKDPQILIEAIHDAQSIANYLEYHAGILSKEEYENLESKHFYAVDTEKTIVPQKEYQEIKNQEKFYEKVF